jgi:hypothetical protein
VRACEADVAAFARTSRVHIGKGEQTVHAEMGHAPRTERMSRETGTLVLGKSCKIVALRSLMSWVPIRCIVAWAFRIARDSGR